MTELSKRYCVLTEGREDVKGHIVLPGAIRLPCDQTSVPVTLGYEHHRIIGAANAFERGPVRDGYAGIYFSVRFTQASGLTHDEMDALKAGVYLSDIFAYQSPGECARWITDGIIREVSFYDASPPAVKISDGRWD